MTVVGEEEKNKSTNSSAQQVEIRPEPPTTPDFTADSGPIHAQVDNDGFVVDLDFDQVGPLNRDFSNKVELEDDCVRVQCQTRTYSKHSQVLKERAINTKDKNSPPGQLGKVEEEEEPDGEQEPDGDQVPSPADQTPPPGLKSAKEKTYSEESDDSDPDQPNLAKRARVTYRYGSQRLTLADMEDRSQMNTLKKSILSNDPKAEAQYLFAKYEANMRMELGAFEQRQPRKSQMKAREEWMEEEGMEPHGVDGQSEDVQETPLQTSTSRKRKIDGSELELRKLLEKKSNRFGH